METVLLQTNFYAQNQYFSWHLDTKTFPETMWKLLLEALVWRKCFQYLLFFLHVQALFLWYKKMEIWNLLRAK